MAVDIIARGMAANASGGGGGDTIETNPSMTGADLYLAISNSKLKVGTAVLCTTDYENNGITYKAGCSYRIDETYADGKIILTAVDLTTTFVNGIIGTALEGSY